MVNCDNLPQTQSPQSEIITKEMKKTRRAIHSPSPNIWIKFETPCSGLYPNKTIISFSTTVAVCPDTPTGLTTELLNSVHCLDVVFNIQVSLETAPFLQVPPNKMR